ncbi:MAG: NERD domain-containing protein [Bacteroidales bacterium]|nr:NERD domain-containing protein [Bacteroidales bacterium]
MALIVKHNRANHTHENEQFRRVASLLKTLFEQRNWNGLLIGNPYNENYPRFRADAILLYNNGLIIIDFKDYSGTIKLPKNKNEFETTQWYTESAYDKERIVIKAGSRFINPFKQLFSYREAFKEIVRSEIQLKKFIKENRTCILNIFSGPLIIENSIPKEIPFYRITQESDLEKFLYDYSSDNTYTKEAADALSKIFYAEDWIEHIEIPKEKLFAEQKIKIDTNVETAISNFLKIDDSGILVLESMSSENRDNWVQYILSVASNFNIPQIETWIYSARIGKKVSLRLGIELQSLYSTIYGNNLKTLEPENIEQDNIQPGDIPNTFETEDAEQDNITPDEHLQIVIPIRSDDSIDQSAVIILHEAHLVSRSFHQSELLRFGSGRLLEDLLKFLKLNKTKRKLICIGDPYSLTFGKHTESAINLNTLAKLYSGKISYYRQMLTNENLDGKFGLKNILASGIEQNLFNHLEYPWKTNDLCKIDEDKIPNYLADWFSAPFDTEPNNVVMVFSNKDAKKINLWIKQNCIKNGKDLAKNDLLLVNNTVNIPDETGFQQPTKLYNGMYLLVEEVYETISKTIPITQSKTPILLRFTKVKVKCLSSLNKLTAKVWLLDNYLQNDDKLSREEQIALRVFVDMLLTEKIKEMPFESSHEYIQLTQDEEYKTLLAEEKDLDAKYKVGEKVITKLEQKQREIRKIENKYKKIHRNRILSEVINTNPFVNAVHATYGWAITVHKCIGSTFANAIINAYQGENRCITTSDYYRWLYSGVTAVSNTLLVANPQIIHPLMNVQFEDTTTNNTELSDTKKPILIFKDYEVDNRFLEKIPGSLNENVKGSICELAKLLEQRGFILELVIPSGEYLTKVIFSITSNIKKHLIIAISNKGAKDNWGVSSIRIEKSEYEDNSKINECIESLFLSQQENINPIPFPSDFRGKIYEKWATRLSDKGYNLQMVENHKNQDIFIAVSKSSKTKFRVWYRDNGFISKIEIV